MCLKCFFFLYSMCKLAEDKHSHAHKRTHKCASKTKKNIRLLIQHSYATAGHLRAILNIPTRWQTNHGTGRMAGCLVCCLGLLIILLGFVVMMVHSVPALIWHFVLAADLSFMFRNESSRLLHLHFAAEG